MAIQTFTYTTAHIQDRKELSSSEEIVISLSSKIFKNLHTSLVIADDDDMLCDVIKDCLVSYYNLVPTSLKQQYQQEETSEQTTTKSKESSSPHISGHSFVTIHTASTPLELEDVLRHYRIDLCLLDLMFEGYGMIDPVGIAARYPQTRFIVISGYLDNIKPDNLIFFAAKPFDTRYLAKLIDLSLEFNLDNKNINRDGDGTTTTNGGSGYRQ